MEVLYGLHPVEEAIRSGSRQLDHVSVARERRDERLERLIELCRKAGVRVSLESRDQLTMAGADGCASGRVGGRSGAQVPGDRRPVGSEGGGESTGSSWLWMVLRIRTILGLCCGQRMALASMA